MTAVPFRRRGRVMKFRTFARAAAGELGCEPNDPRLRALFDLAISDGITSVSEAKRILVEVRREDLKRQLAAAHPTYTPTETKPLLFGADGNPVTVEVPLYGPGVEDH